MQLNIRQQLWPPTMLQYIGAANWTIFWRIIQIPEMTPALLRGILDQRLCLNELDPWITEIPVGKMIIKHNTWNVHQYQVEINTLHVSGSLLLSDRAYLDQFAGKGWQLYREGAMRYEFSRYLAHDVSVQFA